MKNIAYFVAGLLLVSGLAAIGVGEEAGNEQLAISLTFSDLEVVDSDIEQYLEINFEGTSGHSYKPGEPVMPTYQTTIDLPFGIQVIDIQCQLGNIQTETLSSKVLPGQTAAMPSINVLELKPL